MLMSSFSSTSLDQMTFLQGALCQALSDQSSTHSYTNTLRSEEPPWRSHTSSGAVQWFGEVPEPINDLPLGTITRTTSKPSLALVKSESARKDILETFSNDLQVEQSSLWEKSPQKQWRDALFESEITGGAFSNLGYSKTVMYAEDPEYLPKSPTCVENAKGGVTENAMSAAVPQNTSKNAVYSASTRRSTFGPNAPVVTLRDLVVIRKSQKSVENAEAGDE